MCRATTALRIRLEPIAGEVTTKDRLAAVRHFRDYASFCRNCLELNSHRFQLGIGDAAAYKNVPTLVLGSHQFTAVSTGLVSSIMINSAVQFTREWLPQILLFSYTASWPVLQEHTCAINATLALFCWGRNSLGQVIGALRASQIHPAWYDSSWNQFSSTRLISQPCSCCSWA
jgi:hypothetical protein